jgi:hypothetical protein
MAGASRGHARQHEAGQSYVQGIREVISMEPLMANKVFKPFTAFFEPAVL